MRPFVILYNEKYAKLASVAADSIWHFSSSPCITVDIGLCGGQNQFTEKRAIWIAENAHRFKDGFCLLDADMIATPLVDTVWRYHELSYYPIFMLHPCYPIPKPAIAMVKVCSDFVYRQSVPSIWPSNSEWFARAAVNTMRTTGMCDEWTFNYLTWVFGFEAMLPILSTPSTDPADSCLGAFYHGEKDVDTARVLLETLKRDE